MVFCNTLIRHDEIEQPFNFTSRLARARDPSQSLQLRLRMPLELELAIELDIGARARDRREDVRGVAGGRGFSIVYAS